MLVSASFAIGSSVSNVVSALIFVLLMRPYQVGDRVTCSDVFGGQETLLVMQARVLVLPVRVMCACLPYVPFRDSD